MFLIATLPLFSPYVSGYVGGDLVAVRYAALRLIGLRVSAKGNAGSLCRVFIQEACLNLRRLASRIACYIYLIERSSKRCKR
jgi:hypothetical protein